MATPYQRIVRAAKLGKGVHLSAEECTQMAADSAIIDLAANDDWGEAVVEEARQRGERMASGGGAQ